MTKSSVRWWVLVWCALTVCLCIAACATMDIRLGQRQALVVAQQEYLRVLDKYMADYNAATPDEQAELRSEVWPWLEAAGNALRAWARLLDAGMDTGDAQAQFTRSIQGAYTWTR